MSTLSPRHEVSEFRKRYKWMALFVVAVFGVLTVRLAQLQLFQHGSWLQAAQGNITRTVPLPPARGLIEDTQGTVIAANRPSYDVFFTPRLVRMPEDVERIISLMDLTAADANWFRAMLEDMPEARQSQQVEVFTDISREQLAALETHLSELPAVDIVTVPVRHYPHGTLGAHALGYLNEVGTDDMAAAAPERGYRAGDRIGRTGIERRFEQELRGRRGFRRIIVDARGKEPDAPGPASRQLQAIEKPVPGHTLTLTLDIRLMTAIDEAFRGRPSGAAVAIDVHTGAVRALYSKPAFDPNEMSAGISKTRYEELTSDVFRPLIDKTTYETYFPGSTFKPVTALAALEAGTVDTEERLECSGFHKFGRQRFRCNKRHEWVDVYDAIVRSCNVYFWKTSEELGLERIDQLARDFGFSERTGIDINTESRGFLATREWYTKTYGAYRPGYTLNTAIGQGNTRVTVLQLALAYAAIANGGTLYVPQVVERLRQPDGTVTQSFQPVVKRQLDIRADHLDLVRRALSDVVNDKRGTAYKSRIQGGVKIAGKTGTAQVIGRGANRASGAWYFDRDHGWFAGFAPVEDPTLAIAILTEHGGSGGTSAAPIATRILDNYFSELQSEVTHTSQLAGGL